MADVLDFKVVSTEVYSAPQYMANGDAILARMVIEYGPIRFAGCSLVQLVEGGRRVWLPSSRPPGRVVLIGSARKHLLHLALQACGLEAPMENADTPVAKATKQ